MNARYQKYIRRTVFIIGTIYVVLCALISLFQEKLLFHPEAVPKIEQYSYDQEFIEKSYKVADGIELNTLLFKSDSVAENRKLIFYIHGNAENLTTAGGVASMYTDLGYDCFLYDFRGFGKSDGKIDSESGLFADAQILYSQLVSEYKEENITIVGYSIGTGIASWLAAKNAPNNLILQAPYFSMKDMMGKKYPIFPKFLLRYPLETNKRLSEASCPIYIFHGTKDESIPYSSSLQLKKTVKRIDLTKLEGMGHTGYSQNATFRSKLSEILSNE